MKDNLDKIIDILEPNIVDILNKEKEVTKYINTLSKNLTDYLISKFGKDVANKIISQMWLNK